MNWRREAAGPIQFEPDNSLSRYQGGPGGVGSVTTATLSAEKVAAFVRSSPRRKRAESEGVAIWIQPIPKTQGVEPKERSTDQ